MQYLVMRFLKILAVVLLAGGALLVLLNLWLDSRENQKFYSATSADAERDKIAGADAFDRGWLPVVLKSGAREIREEHNVSTNQGRALERENSLDDYTSDAQNPQPVLTYPTRKRTRRAGCRQHYVSNILRG